MQDDLEIDDILVERKKKINSSQKGKRYERELCKILEQRFGKPFHRSVGSGNRWGQVSNLHEHEKQSLIGDISCPDGFKFTIECKAGYEDKIDFNSILVDGNRTIDQFLDQVSDDSQRSSRLPLLLYRRTQKSWIAFTKADLVGLDAFEYGLKYRDWTALSLSNLLNQPDDFFWDKQSD